MRNSNSYLLALVAIGHFLGYIQAHPIQITVETSAGNALSLKFEPTDTIEQVKRAIEKREHVPAGLDQRLHFGDKELKSHKQLQAYGIKAGSVLVQSSAKNGFKKAMEKAFKEIVTCGKGKEGSNANGKDGGCTMEPVEPTLPETNIEVFVKTPKGVMVGLEMGPSESIGHLKQAIESLTKVPADDQRFFLDEGWVLGEGDKTLDSDGNPKDSMMLQVFHSRNTLDLIIEASNGHVFTHFFQPSDTIEQVKREIERRSGVALDQQVLRVAADGSGEMLDDEQRTLESYGIQNGSIIVQTHLPKSELDIVVETLKGHSFVLHVGGSDKVEQVRRELERRIGRLPADEQRLVFAGEQLKSDRTLSSYNIGTGAQLFQARVPLHRFRLSIQTSTGHAFSVPANTTTTIGDIKREIFKRDQINLDDQRLFLDGGSMLKDDSRTLVSYKIAKDSTILQVIHPSTKNALDVIIETSNGHVFTSVFQPSDRIKDVEQEIAKRGDGGGAGGTQFEQHILSVANANLTLDDEWRTLESYGIQSGTTIVQTRVPSAELEIVVENSKGYQFVLHVKESDKVELVQREIERRDGRIPFDKQRLVFAGEQLDNDRTLGSYNIRTGSMLFQTLRREIRIVIESSSGSKWKLSVDPTDLVDEIKAEFERRENIPVDHQRLVFDGKTLEPGTRLDEYNISTGDTVKLHADGPIRVLIETSKGHLFAREFQANETILEVKKFIAAQEDIREANQVISLNSKVLRDDKTLDFYGVSARSTLVQS